MNTVTYSELRQNLKGIMDRSSDRHEPVLVKRQNGDPMVLVSLQDYQSMEETAYLLRSPANAKRLLESLRESRSGNVAAHDLLEGA